MFQDFIEILILSTVQGISEFLPISSSAHLILISNFYDFSSSSLFIDIGLHLGSLFAIIYYFKRDCIQNSIYGVDIDYSAVEIAKLRLSSYCPKNKS